jgi:hypothetical protein
MLKSGATITVIAAMIAARVAFAQAPPTDKELRSAFCIGALDAAVASDSPLIQLPPPSSLPPAYARLAQEANAKTRREISEGRERLRRFLLPSTTIGGNPLSLRVATNEGGREFRNCVNESDSALQDCMNEGGGRVFGDCMNEMNSKPPGPACTRTRRCFHLDDWLPY